MLPEDEFSLAVHVTVGGVRRYVTVADSDELSLMKEFLHDGLRLEAGGLQGYSVVARDGVLHRAAEAAGAAWPPADYQTEWFSLLHTTGGCHVSAGDYARFIDALRQCLPLPPSGANEVALVAHGEEVGSVAVLPHEDPEDVAERVRQHIRRLEAEIARLTDQRNNIAMGASIKLATARMVLSRLLNSSRLDSYEKSALQGVFDVLPAPPSGAIAEADERARLAWERRNGGRIAR